MERRNRKAWLYLLPAVLFLGLFLVYPLIDVLIYSFEQGFNFTSQTAQGIGLYNYLYVLNDPYFLQAMKNTFIPISLDTFKTFRMRLSVMNYNRFVQLFCEFKLPCKPFPLNIFIPSRPETFL